MAVGYPACNPSAGTKPTRVGTQMRASAPQMLMNAANGSVSSLSKRRVEPVAVRVKLPLEVEPLARRALTRQSMLWIHAHPLFGDNAHAQTHSTALMMPKMATSKPNRAAQMSQTV